MAHQKHSGLTRHVINPLVARLHTGGVAALTVVGRTSGLPRTVPVIPVEVDGIRYLVSPFGESQWVRNLRNARTGQITDRAGRQTFRATELPVGERAPVIAAYRRGARREMDRYFSRLPEPADHPVFRITAAGEPPPPDADS